VDTRDFKREAAPLPGHDDGEVHLGHESISIMALIGRLVVILIGFLVASFAAGLIVIGAVLFPDWSDMALGPIDPDAVNVIFGIGFIFVSGFALIPALLVAAITEAFYVRSILVYAVGGAVVGLVCYLGLVPFDPETMSFHGIVRRHLEVMTGAGIVAGMVYWMIAGRNAGAWRDPAGAGADRGRVPRGRP
jgi:hypothetical protein